MLFSLAMTHGASHTTHASSAGSVSHAVGARESCLSPNAVAHRIRIEPPTLLLIRAPASNSLELTPLRGATQFRVVRQSPTRYMIYNAMYELNQASLLKEPIMPERVDKMLEYCISIAQEFQSRVSRMQTFVQHNLSSGSANEIILREFLSSHAARNYDVGQGFICDPSQEKAVSRQCDILVYNQNDYPLVYADGTVKVVWPEAARMAVEVKTNFSKGDILTAIENITSAKALNWQLAGIIFTFHSPQLTTVLKHLQQYPRSIETDYLPDAILLLDKGIIIHRLALARLRDIQSGADIASYAVRVGTGSRKSAVVVAFLLLLFFDAAGGVDYVTNAKNMLMEMIDVYTNKAHDDIIIGTQPK
jgi:hypothetical protein